MSKKYKTVLLPIKVPVGTKCWDNKRGRICEHFNYEYGLACSYYFHLPKFDFGGESVTKPEECDKLKEQK